MKIEKTALEGVLLITPKVFKDNRGYFTETYNQREFGNNGLNYQFVQDNQSYSKEKGTLRGIHFQLEPMAQTKLVRCLKGKFLDVAVDLRKSSPTYKQYVTVELSEDCLTQILIPKGFGHAFLTLTDDVIIYYKVDNLYAAEYDRSIRYNDPELNIAWPEMTVTLSDKDKNAPFLKDSDVNFI